MTSPTDRTVAADDRRAPWRRRLGDIVTGPLASDAILVLIVLNAITLGIETFPSATERYGGILSVFNTVVLAVFVVEITLKLAAFGPRFFLSGWNIFDFAIVTVALVPASGGLSVLRTLRILRALRLLSQVRRLREIIDAIGRSLSGLGWTSLLLLLLFYIFGVMGTGLFRESHPQFFGSLPGSMYSLFQIMTLESWSMGIARPVIEAHPWAWVYFIPFILITSFMVLNLFIAIIVNATQSIHADEAHDDSRAILEALDRMSARIDELSARLEDHTSEDRTPEARTPEARTPEARTPEPRTSDMDSTSTEGEHRVD